MLHKKFPSLLALLLFVILPCTAGGISQWWTEVTSPSLSLDFSLRIQDGKPQASDENFFRWKDKSGDSAKDGLDATTGASKSSSTRRFDSVLYPSEKDTTPAFPESLRNLFLYAVTSQNFMDKDDFFLTQDGSRILIQFRHRGTAYKIQSDEKGFLIFSAPVSNQIEVKKEPPSKEDENPAEIEKQDEPVEENAAEERPADDSNDAQEENPELTEEPQEKNGDAKTDSAERESVSSHFFVAKSVSTQDENGIFIISDNFKNDAAEILWDSLPYEAEMPNPSNSFYYKGKISISFDGTRLSVKGKIKKVKSQASKN